MSPVLEGAIAFAICVPFGFLLLGKVSFTVRNHASHMVDILAGILARLSGRIVFEDLDDVATATLRLCH